MGSGSEVSKLEIPSSEFSESMRRRSQAATSHKG
jgi:hypothetical protein